MEGENQSFFDKLDTLISLFEKLKQKADKEGLFFDKDPLYQNFELLASNYRLIKDSIPPELMNEIGEPIKLIIEEMVEHLRNALGEENTDTDIPLKEELESIDKLLSRTDLSEKEINDLLDRRQNLSH